MDPLSELPIEDGARRRRRPRHAARPRWRTPVIAALGALTVGIIAWQLLPGSEQDAPAANPTTTTLAVTTTSAPELENDTEPGASVDTDDAPRSTEAWIEPASSLSDGVSVAVTTQGPYLAQGAGLALCRRGRTVACTNLETGAVTTDGDAFSVDVTLTRRFVDWQGNVQDCVTIAPCEIRMWAFGTQIDELNVEIDFDPSAPLQESRQPIGAPGLLGPVAELDLTLPSAGALVVHQCVIDLDDSCAAGAIIAPNQIAANDDEAEYIVFPRRRMITSRGPHDCVTDGPCELRFETGDSQRIAPLHLDFRANSIGTAEASTIAVRPSTGLAERQIVEVRITNSPSAVAAIWLCATEIPTCVSLTTASTTEATLISVPRFIDDRYNRSADGPIIDCAVTECEFRVAVSGDHVTVPIAFEPTSATMPDAQVLIASDGPFDSGDEIRLVGRDLFVNASPDDPFVSTRIRFCESIDATPDDCLATAGFSSGIQRDGTIDATLRIPDFDRRRTIPIGAVVSESFCLDSCWLIVETRLEVPGVAIPIEIVDRG